MLIRPIKTEDEYRAVEMLQREIWGSEEIEIIPHDLMMTVHKNGGVMLGAFDPQTEGEPMIGFVFGFIGMQPDGKIKYCSHIAGVTAQYRDRNVGYMLKLAQRDFVMTRGFDLITWTFDPLESRNARFNFHKLGVTCNSYFRNLYGEMRDQLNAGLPSDRFQVDWHIRSDRVENALANTNKNITIHDMVVINPAQSEGLLKPCDHPLPAVGEKFLIQIPDNFQSIKAADRGLALEWRLQTRRLFEDAFDRGYLATDLLIDGGRSFYLMEEEERESTKQTK